MVKSQKRPWWKSPIFFISAFFSILLIIALVVILFILTRSSGIPHHTPRGYPPPDPRSNPNISLSNGVIITSKEEWGGRPPRYVRQLLHPTPYVVVTHTAGPKCKDFSKCSELLRNYQDDHVGQYDQPDIGYNFMIDGVGEVYEGRGWDFTNFIPSFVKRCNIAIAFMGNYLYDTLDKRQIQSFEDLLQLGIKLGKLSTDYKLVLHSQTSVTLSPGKNVELALSSLPHRCLTNCDKGVQCVTVKSTTFDTLNYNSIQTDLVTEGNTVNRTL